MNNNRIHCSAVAATLSYNRSDLEVQKFVGMGYSTTINWNKSNIKDEDKAFQRYILEYFRRINLEAQAEVMQYYNLKPNNTDETIINYFIPKIEFKSYEKSTVVWKKNLIEVCRSANKELFIQQIEMLKIMLLAQDSPKEIFNVNNFVVPDEEYSMPEAVSQVSTEHLKLI